jgi:long-chain acyl-CoA synthetase
VLARVAERLSAFPGHARVRAVHLSLSPWTVENGLMTPTMKLKRPEIEVRLATVIDALYEQRRRMRASTG